MVCIYKGIQISSHMYRLDLSFEVKMLPEGWIDYFSQQRAVDGKISFTLFGLTNNMAESFWYLVLKC